MAAFLSLKEEEMLASEVKKFPVLYDKEVKGYKDKHIVATGWSQVAERLDFIENGRNIQLTEFSYKR